MRWLLVAVFLLSGCLAVEPCTPAWGVALDGDIIEDMVARGAEVERPEHTLGGPGFPGYVPEAALVEVRWKPLDDPVGGNARPHLALYAGSPPEIALKDGEGMSHDFLVDVAATFMPSQRAASDLIVRLTASAVDGRMDHRVDAPDAVLEPSDVAGSNTGGSSGTGFWTTSQRGDQRYELEWRGPVASLHSNGLTIRADTRENIFVAAWSERPGDEVNSQIRDAFSAAGLAEPDLTKTNPVPTMDCSVRRARF